VRLKVRLKFLGVNHDVPTLTRSVWAVKYFQPGFQLRYSSGPFPGNFQLLHHDTPFTPHGEVSMHIVHG